MRNVISLSESIPSLNKFTIPDTGTENEDSVLGEASIGLGRCGDSTQFATTATLPFERAKLLSGGKKTWLGAKPETLEAGGVQTSPWTIGKPELLAAVERGQLYGRWQL